MQFHLMSVELPMKWLFLQLNYHLNLQDHFTYSVALSNMQELHQ